MIKKIIFSLSILSIQIHAQTQAEKLGFPTGKKIIILHADDIGMAYEANQAAKELLSAKVIQSASVMMPCPWVSEFANWLKDQKGMDVGLHLALTSEWKFYRWGSVALVPSLIDPDGFLWKSEILVAEKAKPEEVEREIRAQIEKALKLGIQPTHLDSHMGSLFQRIEFTRVFLKVAEEYKIPPLLIEPGSALNQRFKEQGYPINKEFTAFLHGAQGIKLDDFYILPGAKTYKEKKEKMFTLIRNLSPGLTELVFHPAVESEALKKITNSWQQRVWEAQLFSDPEVQRFFIKEKTEFTQWSELSKRYVKPPRSL